MMRGMFAAISGLRAHQVMLDVTASNIANVNTVGYKAQRTSFKDTLAQSQRGAGAPTGTTGGTNPMSIGLGVEVGSIDLMLQTGAMQTTGSALDVSIQGDGFFRLKTWDAASSAFSPNALFTRAGNFSADKDGYLVSQDGYYVVGYNYTGGAIGTTEVRLQIPADSKSVSIGQDGLVTSVDSAGVATVLGAITLAKFPNNAGLERVAGNKLRESNNSGAEVVGTSGDTNGFGLLSPGSVEMSNVDLAQEFTSMITAQRGFQASSRLISAADEMLQQLVNLGR